MKSSTRLQTLSCYLLICLMTNNEKGQTLARKTKCIDTLRYLFKDARSPSCSPRIPNQLSEYLSSECKENESLITLWQTATSALSACVNNPQNCENQLFCSSAFPAAVSYVRNCDSGSIQTTTFTFLRNVLTNNSKKSGEEYFRCCYNLCAQHHIVFKLAYIVTIRAEMALYS